MIALNPRWGGNSADLGTVSYAYDTLNRLTEINGFNNTKLTFDYDRAGRRTKLNNAIKDVDYKYDIASRLTSVLTNGLSVNYGHDANGNRNSMSINREGLSAINNNLSFDYDKTGQLVGATNPLKGEDNESFTYDDLGNRLLRNGQNTQASYDLNNRLLENETHFFAYDNNGNMVSQTNKASGEVELYTWTSENQLVRIEKKPSLLENATSVIQYEYDVFGRRIYKNIDGLERSYIYDREDILAIFEKQEDGSFNLAMKYLHGPGIDEPIKGFGRDFNETYYADGLGSIVKVERDNGEFFNLVYDSFGRMTVFDKDHQKVTLGKDSLLTYGYTGREIDAESGFNYYRARYYSPEIGRFISEDPIGFAGDDLNLYKYTMNNPVLYNDPTGLFCMERFKDRFKYNYKSTIEATSFVSDSAAFAAIFDSIMDQKLTGAGKPLSQIIRQFVLAGEAGKFNTIRRILPNIAKQVGKTLGKGLGIGFAAEVSFLTGIIVGAFLEAASVEIFSGECDDRCE